MAADAVRDILISRASRFISDIGISIISEYAFMNIPNARARARDSPYFSFKRTQPERYPDKSCFVILRAVAVAVAVAYRVKNACALKIEFIDWKNNMQVSDTRAYHKVTSGGSVVPPTTNTFVSPLSAFWFQRVFNPKNTTSSSSRCENTVAGKHSFNTHNANFAFSRFTREFRVVVNVGHYSIIERARGAKWVVECRQIVFNGSNDTAIQIVRYAALNSLIPGMYLLPSPPLPPFPPAPMGAGRWCRRCVIEGVKGTRSERALVGDGGPYFALGPGTRSSSKLQRPIDRKSCASSVKPRARSRALILLRRCNETRIRDVPVIGIHYVTIARPATRRHFFGRLDRGQRH